MQQETNIVQLNIDLLIPNPHQPRKLFNAESLNNLANSIKKYGILNPILVRKKDEVYEIIAGERRLRAAKIAGLTKVPVIIKEVEETIMAEMALIENLQREDITAIEEAKAYKEILNLSQITEQELSKMIGKSQSFISNKIRLLTLPKKIQEALARRQISERHARSLMTVKDENQQNELLERVIKEKLTVKELDNIINSKKITEEEIQSAINDIMKSLNIDDKNEEKEEEKESDNMNGNFFPNATMGQNQEASLNSMNMQAIPGVPMPEPQPAAQVQEQQAPPQIPNFEMTPPQPELPTQPQVEQPVQSIPTIPNFDINNNPQPVDNITMNQSVPEMPLATPTDIPTEPQPAAPILDQPLFGNNEQPQPVMPSIDIPEPQPLPVSFDIPVTNNDQPTNKVDQVEEFLKNNGITYKKYNNETNSCIIIEL